MFQIQLNNRLKDIKGCREDFGGVSIIAMQLEPVMDGYIFKDLRKLDYAVLSPSLWHKHSKMFELNEIMRQRDSKLFAELVNRLREGIHTPDDILKLKERVVQEDISNPIDVPHLFIQNAKVDEFNERAHNAATGNKFRINAQDSVIGANSTELRDKILRQIPNDPRKTKQLALNLCLAEGERTELAINIQTDDGLTNDAGNVRQLCQAMTELLNGISPNNNIILGDFNINWLVETERRSIYNLLVRDNGYKQLISSYTTDNKTLIDHIYTNILHLDIQSGVLETYFTDHKAVWASFHTM